MPDSAESLRKQKGRPRSYVEVEYSSTFEDPKYDPKSAEAIHRPPRVAVHSRPQINPVQSNYKLSGQGALRQVGEDNGPLPYRSKKCDCRRLGITDPSKLPSDDPCFASHRNNTPTGGSPAPSYKSSTTPSAQTQKSTRTVVESPYNKITTTNSRAAYAFPSSEDRTATNYRRTFTPGEIDRLKTKNDIQREDLLLQSFTRLKKPSWYDTRKPLTDSDLYGNEQDVVASSRLSKSANRVSWTGLATTLPQRRPEFVEKAPPPKAAKVGEHHAYTPVEISIDDSSSEESSSDWGTSEDKLKGSRIMNLIIKVRAAINKKFSKTSRDDESITTTTGSMASEASNVTVQQKSILLEELKKDEAAPRKEKTPCCGTILSKNKQAYQEPPYEKAPPVAEPQPSSTSRSESLRNRSSRASKIYYPSTIPEQATPVSSRTSSTHMIETTAVKTEATAPLKSSFPPPKTTCYCPKPCEKEKCPEPPSPTKMEEATPTKISVSRSAPYLGKVVSAESLKKIADMLGLPKGSDQDGGTTTKRNVWQQFPSISSLLETEGVEDSGVSTPESPNEKTQQFPSMRVAVARVGWQQPREETVVRRTTTFADEAAPPITRTRPVVYGTRKLNPPEQYNWEMIRKSGAIHISKSKHSVPPYRAVPSTRESQQERVYSPQLHRPFQQQQPQQQQQQQYSTRKDMKSILKTGPAQMPSSESNWGYLIKFQEHLNSHSAQSSTTSTSEPRPAAVAPPERRREKQPPPPSAKLQQAVCRGYHCGTTSICDVCGSSKPPPIVKPSKTGSVCRGKHCGTTSICDICDAKSANGVSSRLLDGESTATLVGIVYDFDLPKSPEKKKK